MARAKPQSASLVSVASGPDELERFFPAADVLK
jgi:hypothetical protein